MPENVLIDFFDGKRCAQWTLETQEKSTKIEKISKFQNPEKRFKKCPNLLEVIFSIFSCPVHPVGSKLGKIRKKKRKQFENSKVSKKVPKSVQTCFEAISLKFFVHCTLEGREVEKFQKNGKTSEFSNWPKTFSNVSILVLRGFFSNFYLPVHPGDQKFEQKLKKIEFLKVSKNVLKSFQTSSEHVLRYFSGKNFCPVHPGWSKLAKNTKKWKNFETFKILQKRSQKHCLIMCCMIISTEKNSAQCTLETRKSSTEIEKNSNFQKCPKTFPRLSKHVLMWFFRDFLFSAPWRVEKSKNFKKMEKKLNFQNPEKRFQKCPNLFWGDFFRIFLDQCTLEIKNSKKESKKFEFLKVSKNVLKSFQTNFELVLRYFSEKKFAQCTLEGRSMEKHQKNGKTFIFFSKCPKTFPEKVKHILNMLRGSFFGKKIWPVHPRWSKLGKIRKKNRKKLKFQKCPKTFLKVSKQVPNLFWGIFREKIFAQCTLEGRKLEKFKKNGKTFIFLQKAQISSQKGSNAFWTCFEVVFSVNSKKKSTKNWNFKSVQKRS